MCGTAIKTDVKSKDKNLESIKNIHLWKTVLQQGHQDIQ